MKHQKWIAGALALATVCTMGLTSMATEVQPAEPRTEIVEVVKPKKDDVRRKQRLAARDEKIEAAKQKRENRLKARDEKIEANKKKREEKRANRKVAAKKLKATAQTAEVE